MTQRADRFLMVLGYVLYSPSRDKVWKNKIYFRSSDAEQAREKIAGHPFLYIVKEVLLGSALKRPYV